MNEALAALFHERVLRPYHDLRTWYSRCTIGQQAGLRLVEQAALALYHFRENIPSGPRFNEILALSPHYAVVRDIANVTKHGVLDKANTPPPVLTSRDAIREVLYLDDHSDEEGTYQFAHVAVLVYFNDGAVNDAIDLLTEVANMWVRMMNTSLGCTLEPFALLATRPSRATARSPELSLTQGVAFDCDVHMRVYDAAAQAYRAKDLSRFKRLGMSIQASPPVSLQLTGVDSTGKKQTFRYQLNDDEVRRLREATSADDRRWVVLRALYSRSKGLPGPDLLPIEGLEALRAYPSAPETEPTE